MPRCGPLCHNKIGLRSSLFNRYFCSALQETGMAMHKSAGPDDLMTASDAGRIIGVSADMVRLLARGGKLAFLSTIRGVRLFRRADVDALVIRRARKKRPVTGRGR
jgi:hypothetical protein